ncbi:hypothetical protein SAMN05444369_101143 [Capnocytophaga haemolytica]|uniref:DUF4249 domain-containing protein n=2 Tax=Capnocytophaga haemolytica TaxID=45243 RepID=A0AAX2GXZ9_9FLAO|nr:hypothetical protein [Capnocytophaga haemolytica]SFN63894.1 hypothetical protein SAMN05444369_101143 [Capnocytophaga haemolytica]SNV03997.1 Uncharacterised protein [Capnocytophaga haemolytica]
MKKLYLLILTLVFMGCWDKKASTQIDGMALDTLSVQNASEFGEARDVEQDTIKATKTFKKGGKQFVSVKGKDLRPYHIDSKMKLYYAIPTYLNLSESVHLPPHFLTAKELKKDSLVLDVRRRAMVLKSAGISKRDTIYVYEVNRDTVFKIPVKGLQAKCYINIYEDAEDRDDSSYEYGLALPKGLNFDVVTYTYVGAANPFQTGKRTFFQWQAIEQFPFVIKPELLQRNFVTCYQYGKAYRATVGQRNYYLLSLTTTDGISDEPSAYYLVIEDSKSKKRLFDKTYVAMESPEEILPLCLDRKCKENAYNTQWTGEILKGKGTVIAGFYSPTFGCDVIEFIDDKAAVIPILCDNRH